MKIPILITALLAFASPTSAQQPKPKRTIESIRAGSNQAIASGNISAFASSLDTDFIVVTGNGTLLTREAYIAAFAGDFRDPHSIRFERIPVQIDLSSSAPLAAEHGHWIGRTLNGPVLYTGTYLAMWRNTSSGWKLRSELFVSLTCSSPEVCEAYRKRYQPSATH
jgi:hypothetical protein